MFSREQPASKLWLLAVPVAVLPLALFAMGFSSAVGGAIFGPPPIWARPAHKVAAADVSGTYIEVKRNIEDATAPNARVVLQADGSAQVSGLPDAFAGTCVISGHGKWAVEDDAPGIDVQITSDGAANACDSMNYRAMFLLDGRSKPFGLFHSVGDPDSGEGVWLAQQR